MEHRPHLQLSLADAEGSLDHPKAMLLADDLCHVKVGVCHIALQPVPAGILKYLVLVDGDRYVLADVEELVVSPSVYLVLGQRSLGVSMAKPIHSFVTVVGVFLGPGLGVADDKPAPASFAVLLHVTVHLFDRQHPLLDRWGLLADAGADDVLVASLLEKPHVGLAHETRIGHHDEVCQREPPDEVVDDRYHRVAPVLLPVEDGVGKRVSVLAHQQAEDDLRLCGLAVLGEPVLAELVRGVGRRLEVERGDIVEDQAYPATKNLHRVFDAYPLDKFPLRGIELVHVSVDAVELHVLVEVRLQVVRRRHLAHGLADSGNGQVAEDVVANGVKAYVVIYAA